MRVGTTVVLINVDYVRTYKVSTYATWNAQTEERTECDIYVAYSAFLLTKKGVRCADNHSKRWRLRNGLKESREAASMVPFNKDGNSIWSAP